MANIESTEMLIIRSSVGFDTTERHKILSINGVKSRDFSGPIRSGDRIVYCCQKGDTRRRLLKKASVMAKRGRCSYGGEQPQPAKRSVAQQESEVQYSSAFVPMLICQQGFPEMLAAVEGNVEQIKIWCSTTLDILQRMSRIVRHQQHYNTEVHPAQQTLPSLPMPGPSGLSSNITIPTPAPYAAPLPSSEVPKPSLTKHDQIPYYSSIVTDEVEDFCSSFLSDDYCTDTGGIPSIGGIVSTGSVRSTGDISSIGGTGIASTGGILFTGGISSIGGTSIASTSDIQSTVGIPSIGGGIASTGSSTYCYDNLIPYLDSLPDRSMSTNIKLILKNRYGFPKEKAAITMRIRKIGTVLAREAIFGPYELKACSLKGRDPDKPQLDPLKMKVLEDIIRHLINYNDEEEFQQYWIKVSMGIGQECKTLRAAAGN